MRFVPFALPPDAFARRLDALRFTFHKWDLHVRGRGTVAPGALVLTAAEHAFLVRASEALFALATRASPLLAAEPGALGAPRLEGALGELKGSPAGRAVRFDFFLTREGWRVSEFNDDVPGGYNDAIGLPALFHDAVEKDLEIAGDLPDALPSLVAGDATRVGLVYATAFAEDLQVVRLLSDLLESRGVSTVLASPAHFAFESGRATLAGEPVDRIYRFYPAEWYPLLPNLDAWVAAVRGSFPVVNPFEVAWTQSKLAFARLPDLATPTERPLVETLLPRTLPLTGETRALAEADPDRWVLKPAFGRMGEGVSLGALLPRDAWRARLTGALRARERFALQERFHPLPLETAPGRSATPCIGVYVVDGRFAGYYTRTSETPVVAYDAANVLTLVERA